MAASAALMVGAMIDRLSPRLSPRSPIAWIKKLTDAFLLPHKSCVCARVEVEEEVVFMSVSTVVVEGRAV
jgi:hypothetical protein